MNVTSSVGAESGLAESLCSAFLEACHSSANESVLENLLSELRNVILKYGLPDEKGHKSTEATGLRGRVWKALLAVTDVNAGEYMSLVELGRSERYGRIRGDSFRTFPSDTDFQEKVPESAIVRVLNCFHHHNEPNFSYIQGLNAICGPFLFCMSEVDAYYAFRKFVAKRFPLYWVSSYLGAHAGCMLVDECLAVVDKELASHLNKHQLIAYVYAFHCVSSLSASVPPFREVMHLWDFLVAFGPQFNVLCVVAQILSLRATVMGSNNPGEILHYRKWPRLRAKSIVSVASSLVKRLPKDLYSRICLHATDETVATQITGRPMNKV